MRKSAVVIGFGAFFLTMALLLKFYAYDKLTVVPADTNVQQVLNDPKAKFFDADTLTFKQGDVKTTQTVVADKKASDKQGGNSIVLNISQTTDNNDKAPPIDAFSSHFAVDRHTGKVLKCCDDTQSVLQGTTNVNKPVEHSGYTIKFPFDAGKGSYDYWDNTTRKPMTMKYVGTATIRGLKVNKYHGVVSPTTYAQQALPGFLFGGAKDSPGVTADRIYSNDRTIWAEPKTGAFIKVVEHEVVKLSDPKSGKSVVGIDTNQVMNDSTIKDNVDEYKGKASQLKLLNLLPWVLGILGLLLLVAGIALLALAGRGDSNRRDNDGEHGEPGTRRGGSTPTDDGYAQA